MMGYFHVGFTGTRFDPAPLQKIALMSTIKNMDLVWGSGAGKGYFNGNDSAHRICFHHGCCVGADEFAHYAADLADWAIELHPPVDESDMVKPTSYDNCRTPLTYMKRNKAIVDVAKMMLVVPNTMTEQQRSGTWATYRMAKKKGIERVLVLPDGTVIIER